MLLLGLKPVEAASTAVAEYSVSTTLRLGQIAVTEVITFESPLEVSDLRWNLPINIVNRPNVTANGQYLATQFTPANQSNFPFITSSAPGTITHLNLTYRVPPIIEQNNSTTSWRWTPSHNQPWLIKKFSARATLPFTAQDESLTFRVFSTATSKNVTQPSLDANQMISLNGTNLAPGTGVTILSEWPNHMWATSSADKALLILTPLLADALWPLVIVALALVMAFGGIIATRIVTDRVPRQPLPKALTPPDALSPLIVRSLWKKNIDATGLMATLVDLAQRGYIDFVVIPSGFQIARRRNPDDELTDWEKQLLEQVFMSEIFKVGKESLLQKIKARFITPQMKFVYYRVNKLLLEGGYFSDHPLMTIIRFKLLGLITYLIICIVLVIQVVYNAPAQQIVPLIPLLICAIILLQLARFAPERNDAGREVLARWLSFRRLMMKKEPLHAQDIDLFAKLLPYAIALGVEKQWYRRFRGTSLPYPAWLDYGAGQHETHELTQAALVNLRHVTKMLQSLRGPTA